MKGSILDRTDKVDGGGIIVVNTAPVTLSLVNVSLGTIYFFYIIIERIIGYCTG